MVNPLMNRQKVTSTDPQEHELKPVPEHVEGDNNPYRGMEDHGVTKVYNPEPVPEYDEDVVPGLYMADKPEPDPVPVRIVGEYTRELRMWRNMFALVADMPQRIVGAYHDQTALKIRNQGPAIVYLSSVSSVSPMSGYPLAVGQELALSSRDDVWAVAAPAIPDKGGWINLVPRQIITVTSSIFGPDVDVSAFDSVTLFTYLWAVTGTTPRISTNLWQRDNVSGNGGTIYSSPTYTAPSSNANVSPVQTLNADRVRGMLYPGGASADATMDAELWGYFGPKVDGIPQQSTLAIVREYTVKDE